MDLVTDAGLLGCKPASTPMDPTKQLQSDAGEPLADPTVYRRLIGRLVYLCITRPDITFAVNKLSRFLSNPCSEHLLAGERIGPVVQTLDTPFLVFASFLAHP
ncbi:hypothetical protein SASPL_154408 [Salvia splendens]|uniref:Mitochondrial protein n=1 Tax=Salvia splendens TaxID=180675 RepID=A0A8X8YYG7_SALSN|nr:hypothetical protein SASPL_154408 [Salvia splendens]